MATAYQCDHCALFFPGDGIRRGLPKPQQRDYLEENAEKLELCRKCANEFDGRMAQMHNEFVRARIEREGKIRSDPGHEQAREESQS